MSKGESGDEFELKPVDEQAESTSGADKASAGEPEMAFEPIAESEAQPAEISWEQPDVVPPVDQGAETASGAEISAEQFVSAEEPGGPVAELSGAAEQMTAEAEAAGAQQEQAVAEGEAELAPVKLEEQAVEEEKKEEAEEEARPSIFARMAEASPYTVLLGAAFVALVVGVIFLLLELKTYDFDIRAKKARQGAMDRPAAVSPYQSKIV